jgi:16S rRNA (guanine1516-N2)-methyltransferase
MIQEKSEFEPFFIDFLSKSLLYRAKTASLRKELLARALGAAPKEQPFIVDATAGLGRDGFILAALQYEVTMLEREPMIFAQLQDAAARASQHPSTAPIVKRMHLIAADAVTWLPHHSENERRPDIIYLDPMFPLRKKSAHVKKSMRIIQALVEEGQKNDDSEALLSMALSCAIKRVVVKRPRHAAPLAGKLPNFSLTGNHSRFDVYLIIR